MKQSSAHGAICFKRSVISDTWKAVRTCSPRNYHPVMLRSDAYGRSMGALVFGPHGRKNPGTILVRVDDVQAWKHPFDQSCGLYGAHKRPV